MTDIKLARGISRGHRDAATAIDERTSRIYRDIFRPHGDRLRNGARLRPGEPAKLARAISDYVGGKDTLTLYHDATIAPDCNSAFVRLATLRPTERERLGFVEKRYDLRTETFTIGRRRVIYSTADGFVSISDHAYHRYLSREGGTSLKEFREQFWGDVIPLIFPFSFVRRDQTGTMPVFLPCGRGALAGFRRVMSSDERYPYACCVTLDQHIRPPRDDLYPLLRDEDTYFSYDFRTFIDEDALREEQDRLVQLMREIRTRNAEALRTTALDMLIGCQGSQASVMEGRTVALADAAAMIETVLKDPEFARLHVQAMKADPESRTRDTA